MFEVILLFIFLRTNGSKMKKRTKEEAIEKIRWCIRMFDCPFVCGVIRYLFVQVRSDKTFQRLEVYEKKKLEKCSKNEKDYVRVR